ncbi:MAG: HAD-IIB family hydrolase [Mycoplasmataceae bacterium]|nr:HAD-IIB family hydrolase [Mycoplasmataceae bacterium]
MSNFKLNKKEKYIFATDLDGTFLSEYNCGMSINNYKAVNKIKEAGHHFILCTGRSWWWTKMIYEQLELTDPTIHFSGALTHNTSDLDVKIYRNNIPKEVVKNLVKELNLLEHVVEFIVNGRKKQAQFTLGDDIDDLFFNAYEVIFQLKHGNKHEELIKIIEKKLGEKYLIRVWTQSTSTKNIDCVISPAETNKSVGLESIAKQLKIPQKNVIYFGDNINDIEALEWAGMSYVMKNGIKEAKDVADEVLLLNNNEAGVAKKIIELLDE